MTYVKKANVSFFFAHRSHWDPCPVFFFCAVRPCPAVFFLIFSQQKKARVMEKKIFCSFFCEEERKQLLQNLYCQFFNNELVSIIWSYEPCFCIHQCIHYLQKVYPDYFNLQLSLDAYGGNPQILEELSTKKTSIMICLLDLLPLFPNTNSLHAIVMTEILSVLFTSYCKKGLNAPNEDERMTFRNLWVDLFLFFHGQEKVRNRILSLIIYFTWCSSTRSILNPQSDLAILIGYHFFEPRKPNEKVMFDSELIQTSPFPESLFLDQANNDLVHLDPSETALARKELILFTKILNEKQLV